MKGLWGLATVAWDWLPLLDGLCGLALAARLVESLPSGQVPAICSRCMGLAEVQRVQWGEGMITQA